jgi:ribosomal protein L28
MCEFCGKGYQKNNLVSHGIGNRVTGRTGTKKMANLRSKKFVIGGNSVKVTICSGCLKRLRKDANESAEKTAEKTAEK